MYFFCVSFRKSLKVAGADTTWIEATNSPKYMFFFVAERGAHGYSSLFVFNGEVMVAISNHVNGPLLTVPPSWDLRGADT